MIIFLDSPNLEYRYGFQFRDWATIPLLLHTHALATLPTFGNLGKPRRPLFGNLASFWQPCHFLGHSRRPVLVATVIPPIQVMQSMRVGRMPGALAQGARGGAQERPTRQARRRPQEVRIRRGGLRQYLHRLAEVKISTPPAAPATSSTSRSTCCSTWKNR